MTTETARFNQGKADGLVAKTCRFPAHTMWTDGKHFDKDYEAGYWEGYNEA